MKEAVDKARLIRNRLAHIQYHILETQGWDLDGAGEAERKAKLLSRDRCKRRRSQEAAREKQKEEAEPQEASEEQPAEDSAPKRLRPAESAVSPAAADEEGYVTGEHPSLARQWKKEVDSRIREVASVVHPTHCIQGNEQLAWCGKCGRITALGPDRNRSWLHRTCTRPTEKGRNNLASIERGGNPLEVKCKKRKFKT